MIFWHLNWRLASLLGRMLHLGGARIFFCVLYQARMQSRASERMGAGALNQKLNQDDRVNRRSVY